MGNGNSENEGGSYSELDEELKRYTTVFEKGLVFFFLGNQKIIVKGVEKTAQEIGVERIKEAVEWTLANRDKPTIAEFGGKVSKIFKLIRTYQNAFEEIAKKEELIKNIKNSAEAEIKKAYEERDSAQKESDESKKRTKTSIERIDNYTFEISRLKKELSALEGINQIYDMTKQELDKSYKKSNELEKKLEETKKKVGELERKLEDTISSEKLDKLALKKGYLQPAEAAKLKAAEAKINEEYKKLQKDTDELREEASRLRIDLSKRNAQENKNGMNSLEADLLNGIAKENVEKLKEEIESLRKVKEDYEVLKMKNAAFKKKLGIEETETDGDEKGILDKIVEEEKKDKPS